MLPRFAEPLHSGIAGSELVVFDHLSHAGLHEDPETFNRPNPAAATRSFLELRQRYCLPVVARRVADLLDDLLTGAGDVGRTSRRAA